MFKYYADIPLRSILYSNSMNCVIYITLLRKVRSPALKLFLMKITIIRYCIISDFILSYFLQGHSSYSSASHLVPVSSSQVSAFDNSQLSSYSHPSRSLSSVDATNGGSLSTLNLPTPSILDSSGLMNPTVPAIQAAGNAPQIPLSAEIDVHSCITPDKHFLCPVCFMKSISEKDFLRHYMTHTGEKPYACPHCHYRSVRKSNISRHIHSAHGNTR